MHVSYELKMESGESEIKLQKKQTPEKCLQQSKNCSKDVFVVFCCYKMADSSNKVPTLEKS